MFENHRKVALTTTSDASYVFILVDKRLSKMLKIVNLASFWKTEACSQTVLPERSVFIGQKLMENAKIEKFKWDILSNIQTLNFCPKLVGTHS